MSSLFQNVLDKIFLSPTEKVEGDLKSYLDALNSDRFKDKICYGISDADKGFYVVDPVMRPGALYCGGMGSGKSIAMRFTVATHIAVNSKNTFYILVDTLKGMTDYVQLFKDETDDFGNIIKPNPYKKNVVAAVNDSAKIVPVIDMIYEECMARKEEFSRVGANNVYAYDKILKEKENDTKGIARIMVCIEEFHAIPNSPQVKFGIKVDQQGSIANKFKELMRVGRSYGIFFLFATQRATSEDIPTALKPGLSMMMAFRMNNPGEASAMNLPHAQDIGIKQQGRCAYEGGFIQYPYISDSVLDRMLEKYYKPLEAKLLKAQPEDYHKALGGEGNDGMVWIKPFKDIVKFANQYDMKTIVTRLMKSFNMEVQFQPNETYVADMIGYKYENKYAIKLINSREQGSKKEIEALIKGADALGCNKILVIISEVSAPMGLSILERGEAASKTTILDNDDLIQIANMLDSRKELEEKGQFQDFYLRYGISDIRDFSVKNQELEIINNPEKDEVVSGNEIEKSKNSEENVPEVKVAKLDVAMPTQSENTVPSVISPPKNKIELEEVLHQSEKSEPSNNSSKIEEQNELKERLRLEREAYKQRIKEERKKFLEEIQSPIDPEIESETYTKKETPPESTDVEDDSEEVSEEEKQEAKTELDRGSDPREALDKEVLLKIRDRLKQNILKEREG